jgi:hypothetical protein
MCEPGQDISGGRGTNESLPAGGMEISVTWSLECREQ